MPDTAELNAFLQETFPQTAVRVIDTGPMYARVRLDVDSGHLRPGGTVSGPTMFALADTALYVAILGEIGLVPLAVTTNMNINFLRKPQADAALLGECKLIKLGKALAVGDVSIFSEGQDDPVAHATGTYSIPPGSR